MSGPTVWRCNTAPGVGREPGRCDGGNRPSVARCATEGECAIRSSRTPRARSEEKRSGRRPALAPYHSASRSQKLVGELPAVPFGSISQVEHADDDGRECERRQRVPGRIEIHRVCKLLLAVLAAGSTSTIAPMAGFADAANRSADCRRPIPGRAMNCRLSKWDFLGLHDFRVILP